MEQKTHPQGLIESTNSVHGNDGVDEATISIRQLTQLDADTQADLTHLLPQLSATAAIPATLALKQLLAQPHVQLFAACIKGHIVGMLTLVSYSLLSGSKTWVEDVVVDADFRGQGIGAALVQHAIAYAKQSGLPTIDLTSRPERVAANKLYQSLGFELRQTNVYRLKNN